MRPTGSVADCVGSSGNREISRGISETDTCRLHGGFAPFTRISRRMSEVGVNGAYVARWAKYATPRIRGRLRMIFRKSRDFPMNLRNRTMSPARRICAIYSDFSGRAGIRGKRCLRGAWGRNMRHPDPWPIAYDLQEIARSQENLRN